MRNLSNSYPSICLPHAFELLAYPAHPQVHLPTRAASRCVGSKTRKCLFLFSLPRTRSTHMDKGKDAPAPAHFSWGVSLMWPLVLSLLGLPLSFPSLGSKPMNERCLVRRSEQTVFFGRLPGPRPICIPALPYTFFLKFETKVKQKQKTCWEKLHDLRGRG